MHADTLSMTKESGVKSAEKNQELEGDFMLTALETQLNVLTTRIRKVGNNNKSKGRYIPPHERRRSRERRIVVLRTHN